MTSTDYLHSLHQKMCVPVAATTVRTMLQQIAAIDGQVPIIEIRLDYLRLVTAVDVDMLLQTAKQSQLMITYRDVSYGGQRTVDSAEWLQIMRQVIDAGVAYIDVDIQRVRRMRYQLRELLQYNTNVRHPARMICSYHNFVSTPQCLHDTWFGRYGWAEALMQMGFGVIKCATQVQSAQDTAELYRLITSAPQSVGVIAVGMGELGVSTRIGSLLAGAEMSFFSWSKKQATAPGQMGFGVAQDVLRSIAGV